MTAVVKTLQDRAKTLVEMADGARFYFEARQLTMKKPPQSFSTKKSAGVGAADQSISGRRRLHA